MLFRGRFVVVFHDSHAADVYALHQGLRFPDSYWMVSMRNWSVLADCGRFRCECNSLQPKFAW